MEIKDIQALLEGYIQAWQSNDPADIGQLFTTGAQYFTAPTGNPGPAGSKSSLAG